jgi:hypothetical protein
VTILNNTFDNNNLAINDCEVYDNAEFKNTKFNMYPQLRSMNDLQIKSLISIRHNQFTIKIIENKFARNSAIKGLIYIENLKEQTTFKNYVAINGNVFNGTATFFGTSAIFIRSEAN